MLELLGHLAGIDYPAIETNLSSIMQKLLHRAKEKLDDIQSSSKFFQPLIQNAFAVKKVTLYSMRFDRCRCNS